MSDHETTPNAPEQPHAPLDPMAAPPPLPEQQQGVHEHLGPEMDPAAAARLRWLMSATLLFGAGILLGLWLAPDTPQSARGQLEALQAALAQKESRIGELEQLSRPADAIQSQGRLSAKDRARHNREGRAYVAALKRTGAQGAAHLVEWFIGRWNALLDSPQPDDRTGRRAATLALLVGGMAANLNPGDYVPWQAEFLSNPWLGELQTDIDGDGLPGPRSAPNSHDGFANVSVCHVAMALNQAMTDGQILMMPEMRCDRAESRMSVFLQGETFDDALTEFVRAVREQGFLVVERQEKGNRLVLVGNKPTPKTDDDF